MAAASVGWRMSVLLLLQEQHMLKLMWLLLLSLQEQHAGGGLFTLDCTVQAAVLSTHTCYFMFLQPVVSWHNYMFSVILTPAGAKVRRALLLLRGYSAGSCFKHIHM
jgi:hypothetical protein